MAGASDPGYKVFRSGRSVSSLRAVISSLASSIAELRPSSPPEKIHAALLRAGELECALRDAGSDHAILAEHVTDVLADFALAADRRASTPPDLREAAEQCLPFLKRLQDIVTDQSQAVTVSTPEGFAYYAMHPLEYADLVGRIELRPRVCVIGIRSIGTTLSAVVTAALRNRRLDAKRTTVRPAGHPYNRQCTFDAAQCASILANAEHGATFLVCDEGPGRSGSSFLSVAEALERIGVHSRYIVLLCSYEPDVNALCAPDAAYRWSRYVAHSAGITRRLPHDAGLYLGGGEWRAHLLPPERPWPASWTQMERLKYLSCDRTCLLKFEGHGHYGEAVRLRNEALAESRFGPDYLGHEEGFGRTRIETGANGTQERLSRDLLLRMAQYCAWRAKAFAVPSADRGRLEDVTRENIRSAFHVGLRLVLPVERPVISDGRMQPHKWLCSADRGWLTLDGAAHGDDHFLPGPCDIAWDIAGLCIEWALPQEARTLLISEYARQSRDQIALRLPDYKLAYTAFRVGWTGMAASAMAGSPDESRLLADHSFYRTVLETLLAKRTESTALCA